MTRATMPSMSEMMELNRATSYLDPSNAPYTPEKALPALPGVIPPILDVTRLLPETLQALP